MGVETGVDVDDFISFIKKPGLSKPSLEEKQGVIVQKTREEFNEACGDKLLSEVGCTL